VCGSDFIIRIREGKLQKIGISEGNPKKLQIAKNWNK
jgi:hypothetical protein